MLFIIILLSLIGAIFTLLGVITLIQLGMRIYK